MNILSKKGLLCGQSTCKLEFCEHCTFRKQKRVSFSTTTHTTKGILNYIHSDLWGPSKYPSIGGRHYMMTILAKFGYIFLGIRMKLLPFSKGGKF